ncbi:MAG: molybdopterin oxidoreductase, partial [Deltaproteobacteria bacterium]
GLSTGDEAIISTNRGQVKMKVKIDERVSEGIVFVPHGWEGEKNANLLTDTDCREKILGYPDMKSLMCNVARA